MKTLKATIIFLSGAMASQASILSTQPLRTIASEGYLYYNVKADMPSPVEYINYIEKLQKENPLLDTTNQEVRNQIWSDLIWMNQVDRAELRIFSQIPNLTSRLSYEQVVEILLMYKNNPPKLTPISKDNYAPIDSHQFANDYVNGLKQRQAYDGADDYNEGLHKASDLNYNNSSKVKIRGYMESLFGRDVSMAEVEGLLADIEIRNSSPYFPKGISVMTAFGNLLKEAFQEAESAKSTSPKKDLSSGFFFKMKSERIVKIMNRNYQQLPAVVPVSLRLVYLNSKKIEESFSALRAEDKMMIRSDLIQRVAANLSQMTKNESNEAKEEWKKILNENAEKLSIEKSLIALSILSNLKLKSELTTEAARTFVVEKMNEIGTRQMLTSQGEIKNSESYRHELMDTQSAIKGIAQISKMTSNVKAYKCMKNY